MVVQRGAGVLEDGDVQEALQADLQDAQAALHCTTIKNYSVLVDIVQEKIANSFRQSVEESEEVPDLDSLFSRQQ